jgi:hypothetical protein
LLQELGKIIRQNSNKENEFNPFRQSTSPAYREQNLVNWRQNKRIVVNYDENEGNIKSVELADPLFKTTDFKIHQEKPVSIKATLSRVERFYENNK